MKRQKYQNIYDVCKQYNTCDADVRMCHVNRLVNCSVNHSVNRSVNHSINRSVNHSSNWNLCCNQIRYTCNCAYTPGVCPHDLLKKFLSCVQTFDLQKTLRSKFRLHVFSRLVWCSGEGYMRPFNARLGWQLICK